MSEGEQVTLKNPATITDSKMHGFKNSLTLSTGLKCLIYLECLKRKMFKNLIV